MRKSTQSGFMGVTKRNFMLDETNHFGTINRDNKAMFMLNFLLCIESGFGYTPIL